MPENSLENFDREVALSDIKQQYADILLKIQNTKPIEALKGAVKKITVDSIRLSLLSDVFKNYTEVLVLQFLGYLNNRGNELSDGQLKHIQENILRSTTLNLIGEPSELEEITKLPDIQRFLMDSLLPFADFNKMNASTENADYLDEIKNVKVELSKQHWQKILDMSRVGLANVAEDLIDDQKAEFNRIMEENHMGEDVEGKMAVLTSAIDLHDDFKILVAEIAGEYALDMYNNVINHCAMIYQKLMMTAMFGI